MRIKNHPILEFRREHKIKFMFEEKEIFGYEGETIGAALQANGIRDLVHNERPRGIFCAIGNCSSCLMEVNGVPNVRVCIEPLKEGMVVKRQHGQGKFILGGEE